MRHGIAATTTYSIGSKLLAVRYRRAFVLPFLVALGTRNLKKAFTLWAVIFSAMASC